MSLPLALALAAVLAVVVLVLTIRRPPARRAAWSQWPDDDRNMAAIERYYRDRPGSATDGIDDRTWADLNLDAVFSILDRTESRVGQQVLYARLRSAPDTEMTAAFEQIVARFEHDEPARKRAQDALCRIRHADAHDLWSLAQPGSLTAEPWHVVFPLAATVMLGVVVLVPVYPYLLFAVAAGSLVGLILRATAAKHLKVAAYAFRQVGPVLSTAAALEALATPNNPLTASLHSDLAPLSGLRRIASWVGRDSTGAVAGDIGALVVEYLNLLLCLDGNAVYFGARQLRRHGDALLRLVHAVGEVDAALSVASYRAGTPGWTRPVFGHTNSEVVLSGIRHPLLPDAVPNSLHIAPPGGIIITGSNMSGKTTFLRTVGVATVLAQTVNTCLADTYEAPLVVVRSCIGRADEPESGKSYYLVEVDSVLDLVRASATARPHLILFDELFRGTNTTERVAAGEAVLASLLTPRGNGGVAPHVVLAATHDQELVGLLDGVYAAYHFSDTVGPSGLTFDYQLRRGPSQSRNAIALLGLRGAPADLVARATARAEALDS